MGRRPVGIVVLACVTFSAASFVGAPSALASASSAACKVDKSVLQAAEEAYFAMNGRYTGSMGDLIKAEFIKNASKLHKLVAVHGGTDYRVKPIKGQCGS